MIKIKEIQANGFYALEGRSTARSSMIQDKEDAATFLASIQERLSEYFVIHDYLLKQDCWVLLCEIKSEKEIMEAYLRSRDRSKKANRDLDYTEIWRIISEQIRHFLSGFVKYRNKKQERSGSLVHSKYERYLFTSIEEGLLYVAELKAMRLERSQEKENQRPPREEYRLNGWVVGSLGRFDSVGGGLTSKDVLRKLLKFTIKLHRPLITHN